MISMIYEDFARRSYKDIMPQHHISTSTLLLKNIQLKFTSKKLKQVYSWRFGSTSLCIELAWPGKNRPHIKHIWIYVKLYSIYFILIL